MNKLTTLDKILMLAACLFCTCFWTYAMYATCQKVLKDSDCITPQDVFLLKQVLLTIAFILTAFFYYIVYKVVTDTTINN